MTIYIEKKIRKQNRCSHSFWKYGHNATSILLGLLLFTTFGGTQTAFSQTNDSTDNKAPSFQIGLDPTHSDLQPDLSLVNTKWQIEDENGATQILFFKPDGTLNGKGFTQFTRWQNFGNTLQILYQNDLGRRVLREGRLTAPGRLQGTAREEGHLIGVEKSWRWKGRLLTSSPQK